MTQPGRYHPQDPFFFPSPLAAPFRAAGSKLSQQPNPAIPGSILPDTWLLLRMETRFTHRILAMAQEAIEKKFVKAPHALPSSNICDWPQSTAKASMQLASDVNGRLFSIPEPTSEIKTPFYYSGRKGSRQIFLSEGVGRVDELPPYRFLRHICCPEPSPYHLKPPYLDHRTLSDQHRARDAIILVDSRIIERQNTSWR